MPLALFSYFSHFSQHLPQQIVATQAMEISTFSSLFWCRNTSSLLWPFTQWAPVQVAANFSPNPPQLPRNGSKKEVGICYLLQLVLAMWVFMVLGHCLLFCHPAGSGFCFQGHLTVTDGYWGSILTPASHLWAWKGKTLSIEEELLIALHINLLALVPGPQREPENVARPGIIYKSREPL